MLEEEKATHWLERWHAGQELRTLASCRPPDVNSSCAAPARSPARQTRAATASLGSEGGRQRLNFWNHGIEGILYFKNQNSGSNS